MRDHSGHLTICGAALILAALGGAQASRAAITPGKPGRTPSNALAQAHSTHELRSRIGKTLDVPAPLPALETATYGRFSPAEGVLAERVSYATAYGLRIPAIVYRPEKAAAARMPGLVVVNGHGGDKYSWYAYYAGILYARAGAVVVTYDPIGEGERNSDHRDATRQHDQLVQPLPAMAQRLSGLMITDVMQAVSYLRSQPDVDARRIGALGYSMGSFVLALTCAVDARINSCILAGGGNLDGPGGYWDSSKPMCQGIPYQSLRFLGDRGAEIYNLHANRGATLIINGSNDDVVQITRMGPGFFEDLRRRTIALHGSDRNVFDYAFVAGGGHRPYFLTRPAALWLDRHLRFPNWTPAEIEAMPAIRIGDWARQNRVPIEKLYAVDKREGGTEALGADVPAVPHDLLDALPRPLWEREKQKYIYETWVTNALAATRLSANRSRSAR